MGRRDEETGWTGEWEFCTKLMQVKSMPFQVKSSHKKKSQRSLHKYKRWQAENLVINVAYSISFICWIVDCHRLYLLSWLRWIVTGNCLSYIFSTHSRMCDLISCSCRAQWELSNGGSTIAVSLLEQEIHVSRDRVTFPPNRSGVLSRQKSTSNWWQ